MCSMSIHVSRVISETSLIMKIYSRCTKVTVNAPGTLKETKEFATICLMFMAAEVQTILSFTSVRVRIGST